ncbi:MAG: FAD-dependent oxidoreductase [Psychroserpens sp.]|uniref:NAD(P)/FAD-dependent oxidoreductase n=1 Tax=Psychroserpens sp. TaxID=2020870 RepID=UPI003C793D80
MKHVDFIVVGHGLGGVAFCEQLRLAGKTFVVFDNNSQQSSKVAAGVYNPVILKRFTKVWNAQIQLELALPRYEALEALLQVKLNYKLPVLRRFSSVEEQNEWFVASDQPVLCNYLSTDLIKNTNAVINADFSFGKVLHSGRIHTTQLITSYRKYLRDSERLIPESFQYDQLHVVSEDIQYNNIQSKYIVFAEGFGISKNPFFKHLPVNGTKGQMLIIKAPNLKMNFILKSAVFIVPQGNDLYWIGATYERDDKTHNITEDAKEELIRKLNQIITCEYDIVDHVAAIRPTTKDRRPLVGVHPQYNNVCVLNGLGTRGVMISPYVSQQLFNHLEKGTPLNPESDIKRVKM